MESGEYFLAKKALETLPKRKFRFHVLGLCHVPARKELNAEPFLANLLKLCKVLLHLGHEVLLYAAEGSDKSYCTDLIVTHTMTEIRAEFGDKPPAAKSLYHGLGYDYQAVQWRSDYNKTTALTGKVHKRQIHEIKKRKQPYDFLVITVGHSQKHIADAVGVQFVVEPHIGYTGAMTTSYRAFASTSHRDFLGGSEHPYGDLDGKNYDRVIPHYVDPKDFTFVAEPPPLPEGSYLLFLARLIHRKGLSVAIDIAKRMPNERLVIAGQGAKSYDEKKRILVTAQDTTYHLPENATFVGYADLEKRNKLMGNAKVVLCPTIFREPANMVAIEAQATGTPVISTSFGGFADTIEQDVTGYRCVGMNDFVNAVDSIDRIDRRKVYERAMKLFTIESVSVLYEKWFRELSLMALDVGAPDQSGWYYVGNPVYRGIKEIDSDIKEQEEALDK